MRRIDWSLLALGVVIVGAATILAAELMGWSVFTSGKAAPIIALLAMAIFIGGGAFRGYGGRGGALVRDLAIWLAIIVVLAAAWTFREALGF
jgi:hypothetical protein